jgi:SAM-dependent methyltransferase
VRRHDWTGFFALAAIVLGLVQLARGRVVSAVVTLAMGALAAALTRYWSRKYPSPMPHLLRWTLRVPRGNQSPEDLKRILEPRNGERILEIGPGIGLHALPIASALAPDGTLDVLDVQQAMLDDLTRDAHARGIGNITARQGDARRLPYDDGVFDGAYLVGVLGEVPDGHTALEELRRVLKPAGRLVVGEVAFDPDFIAFGALARRATAAGFVFERKSGRSLSYLARFRATSSSAQGGLP